MKKICIIAIAIFWITSGVSGAVKQSLRAKDLTVGRLMVYGIAGAAIGPCSWVLYLMSSDTVLIKRKL